MKVLFIGNSHTFVNEVPKIVEALARRCGINDLETTMLTAGGMSLVWHSQQPSTPKIIEENDFDFAVLQNCAHPFDGIDNLREGANAINAMLSKKGTKPVLYMTWASLRHPEVQSEMIEAYTTVGKEMNAKVAPVGVVWQQVRENTDIDLFFSDGEHASKYGSYLSACVIFCTLTNYGKLIPDAEGDFYKTYDVDNDSLNVIHRYVYDILYKK